MKRNVLAGLMLGVATAARSDKPDRAVPPRHPSNRLNRLANKLAPEIIMHPNLPWSQKRQQRVLGNVQKFADKMKDRFNSPNCGFYDPNLKHGGPDPNPHLKENGKPRKPIGRKRRDTSEVVLAENWWENSWVKADTSFGWIYQYCYDRNHTVLSDDQFDFVTASDDDLCLDGDDGCFTFDMTTCQFKNAQGQLQERGKRGGRKLSDNPQKAWKQVTTGLKKWALRYLNNCYGMRKGKLPANRAKALYVRWVDEFPTQWA